ncbi:MAG: NAD(P)/FAD-dependent oxidoreductase [Vicinamibacterales bacterium]
MRAGVDARPFDYDVAVIGGGPTGSSAATTLARAGRSVLVVERDVFPRFHIGESQLPWINGILERLGALEKMKTAGFVQKWGASFTTADGSASQYADFSRAVEVPQPQTWQVPRADFDHLLLEHARSQGASVEYDCRADDIAFAPDGVTLTLRTAAGSRTVRAAAVVDASGRHGVIAKRFGTRVIDPLLQNIAVHAQFTGVPRAEGRRAGDIRMVTRPDRGWFWFIPISPTVMSVGVVLPKAVYNAAPRRSPEESLAGFIAEAPAAAALMANAQPVSPARFEADFSYVHSQLAGDRFVIAGDAGAFLDPIFSTGVLLGMQAGIDAAEALDAALAAGDLSRSRFAAYEAAVVRRYQHFRRFVVGFYDPAFRDLFFQPSGPFGTYEAVLSVLGGNWKPSLLTRLRLWYFLALVRLQRHVALAPRLWSTPDAVAAAETPLADDAR